jgi:ferrochelatase
MDTKKKIAVILVAHGEAETAGFFENYQVTLHTLRHASEVIPVPVPLQHFISFNSSLRKRFTGNHNGSPQNPLTRRQALSLQNHLDLMAQEQCPDFAFEVMAAFSASKPFAEMLLEKTREYDGRILIPMAPVDNAISCGLLCAHLGRVCSSFELSRSRVIGKLWKDETLHLAILDHLFKSSRPLQSGVKERNALMLLFHGTLVEDHTGSVPSFHTGYEETIAFSRQLASRIGSDPGNPWGTVMPAFLNHDVGGKWSGPSFEEAVRMLSGKGYHHVSLFAAGYFSDGNETVNREKLVSAHDPSIHAETIPCLNDSPHLISWLAGRVISAARQIVAFSGDSAGRAV